MYIHPPIFCPYSYCHVCRNATRSLQYFPFFSFLVKILWFVVYGWFCFTIHIQWSHEMRAQLVTSYSVFTSRRRNLYKFARIKNRHLTVIKRILFNSDTFIRFMITYRSEIATISLRLRPKTNAIVQVGQCISDCVNLHSAWVGKITAAILKFPLENRPRTFTTVFLVSELS